MNHLEFMIEAYKEAEKNALNNFEDGGPFGAVVVKDGKIIGRGRNNVLSSHNPTAHAEITAIEDACNYLKSHDLTGCVLYATCYPCAMCLSAIMWSHIKEVYYGNTNEDAVSIGFGKDGTIYNAINNVHTGREEDNKGILELHQVGREKTIETFEKFKNLKGELY